MTTTTIDGRCHCGTVAFSYEIPIESLPLKAAICHCDTCRYTSGQLIVTWCVLPVVPDVSKLTAYESSSSLIRYFCPKCGASAYNLNKGAEEEEWDFATGLLNKTEGILDRVQLWIEDTVDGGTSQWIESREKHMRGRDSTQKLILNAPQSIDKQLAVACHCGDVTLSLSRPAEGDDQWWKKGDKFLAWIDTCTSCRQTTGFEAVTWVSISLANLSHDPLDISGLVHYESSPGVWRDFCGRCGAKVHYRRTTRKGGIIDVGTGLIRASNGARAEGWLDWGELVYAEDATDQKFVSTMVQHLCEFKEQEK